MHYIFIYSIIFYVLSINLRVTLWCVSVGDVKITPAQVVKVAPRPSIMWHLCFWRLTLHNSSLFGHRVISTPQPCSGQATHLSLQFNCLISPPKNCSHHTSDLYLPRVCFFSPSPSTLTFLAGWNCFIIPPESVKSPSSYKLITHHWLFVWEEIKCRDFLGDRFV